jgi:hypothetical protein
LALLQTNIERLSANDFISGGPERILSQAEGAVMSEFLSKFSGGELIAVVAIVGGMIFGALVMAGEFWHRIRKAEIMARLKQDMLDRGMTPDEIRTVIEAGSGKHLIP